MDEESFFRDKKLIQSSTIKDSDYETNSTRIIDESIESNDSERDHQTETSSSYQDSKINMSTDLNSEEFASFTNGDFVEKSKLDTDSKDLEIDSEEKKEMDSKKKKEDNWEPLSIDNLMPVNDAELNFDNNGIESESQRRKRERLEIQFGLRDQSQDIWRILAKHNYGLVNDEIRKKVWPILLEIDPSIEEPMASIDEIKSHPEFHQVVLDVNRSLKRFPPGIPYEQRLALQDQLTALILRVIMKYPDLNYYQGYHDVAITFLLVVGETMAYRIMTRLSTNHLRECMEPTMDSTSYRLNYIYPIIEREHPSLHEYLNRAGVGTIFALPWYITWFGHSLANYSDVVRLYDYFLASPPLAPLYVAAALVISRAEAIFSVPCEMANIHCLLTNIPEDISFEKILVEASRLYDKYPPHELDKDVQIRVENEKQLRKQEQERVKRLQVERQLRNCSAVQRQVYYLRNFLTTWLPHSRVSRVLLATTTVAIAALAYYRGNDMYYVYNRSRNDKNVIPM